VSGGDPSRWPLFLRIFGLMMLMLMLVQALNFALVMLVPPPRPPVTTLEHVVAALRTGRVGPGPLTVMDAAAPVADGNQHRADELRTALSHTLDLPQSAIHVRFEEPGFWPAPPRMLKLDLAPGPPPMADRQPRPPNILFGDFAVSARMGDQWRTVRSAGSEIRPWRGRAVAWLLIAIIVVAPFAWLLARFLARPIGVFARAAERLGRDPRAPPLTIEGPREIAHAAAAFNQMQARLNRYVEDRTTLMAAIAHDLRTPLMRLGLRLENAPPELRDACEQDMRDMDAMIGAVMSFLRDMQQRPHRRLDLRSLAESLTDHFQDLGDAVTLEDGDKIIVEGDAPGLKALLANLIGNAVKYAGAAHLRLHAEDGHAVIEVTDDGPGLRPEDLERAFEPFFRAERSRNRDTGGIGLGLASVRAVARAHGGEATLANRPEGGLLARVTLPI